MSALNDSLFLFINAPAHPPHWLLVVAIFLANWLILAIPVLIAVGWLKGGEDTRRAMIAATATAILGLLISLLIGQVWFHPRPFMVGLGHQLIPHSPDYSFPSDHLTLWWSVSFSLIAQWRLRKMGVAVAILGIPIAWARIYLGVHFPFDMAGAVLVASISCWIVQRTHRFYLDALYRLALGIHCRLFRRLIACGWVRGA